MNDPVIDRIVREAEALGMYRRAAQTAAVDRLWAERNGWDEEYQRADRVLGHLRAEIRELDAD